MSAPTLPTTRRLSLQTSTHHHINHIIIKFMDIIKFMSHGSVLSLGYSTMISCQTSHRKDIDNRRHYHHRHRRHGNGNGYRLIFFIFIFIGTLVDYPCVNGQVDDLDDLDCKPSALVTNECNVNDNSDSEEDDYKESDVEEEDDGELDPDDDEEDGNKNLSSIDEDTKKKLMKKLSDTKDIKEPKQCVHPDPNGPNIVRGDGITLDDAKVDKCLDIWETGTNQLNNLFPRGCSPNHPGWLCVVHINCAEESVYDISVVDRNTHTALMSILVLRESIKLMGVGLSASTKRHWFYWEEYKVSPPDQGQYRVQREADRDVALLSNLNCVPTNVIARSSTHSFMRGPFTIERTDTDIRANDRVANMMYKPYGASKYHEINSEWIDEFHGRVPPRKIDLTKVKCIVLIEKEGSLLYFTRFILCSYTHSYILLISSY